MSPVPPESAGIFVHIASYRDPELPRTVASALERAAQPERLRFGVCWQFDGSTSTDLDPWTEDARFGIERVHWRASRGLGWARSRAQRFYAGENYLLQIDAHTRFADGWDTRLVDMLESIPADKPLLTTYPTAYNLRADGRDELLRNAPIQRLGLLRHNADLTTMLGGEVVAETSRPGTSRFLAGGFVFARGKFCTEVPADPDHDFSGEEISLAVRAYTHGWDFFYPNENLLWHLYRHEAPKRWDDNSESGRTHDHSIERLQTLLVGDASKLDPYGLGAERTRRDYERFAGLDFAARLARAATVKYRARVRLDTSAIEPRDDYSAWEFSLLASDGRELFRTDIVDTRVLDGRRRTVSVDLTLPSRPAKYVLRPRRHEGTWAPRVVRDMPV